MIFKAKHLTQACCVIALLITTAACSTLESMLGKAPENTQVMTEETENQHTSADAENTAQEKMSAPDLTNSPQALAEQEKAQAQARLISMPDRFMQSKAVMSTQAKALLKQALSEFQQQDYPEAIQLIEQAKRQAGPLNSSAYVLEGDILLAMKDTSAASLSFDKALSLNADNYKAANRRAQLYRQSGEFDKALALYTQAISAYPAHAPSYRNRGILQDLYMQEKTSALGDYKRYELLLEYQQQVLDGSEASQLALSQLANIRPSLSPQQLKQELRRVKGWIVDLERQLPKELVIDKTMPVSDMPINEKITAASGAAK